MKLGFTVNVGAYESRKFESGEHPDNQSCARDLINQMAPLAQFYPILKSKIDELKKAYNV